MDVLANVEPQLAIPVVGVVLCALLVYVFGFQKTQEPSFQHLAVLQSTGKSNRATTNLRQRSTTPQVKAQVKGKEKLAVNGHAVQEKSSPKPNGSVRSVKKDVSNKENIRPQKVGPKKAEKEKEPEDLESGDWIQAPSRKDKKNKSEKSKQESSQTGKTSAVPLSGAINIEENLTSGGDVLRDVTTKTITESENVSEKQDSPLKEEPAAPKVVKDSKKKKAAPEASSPKKEKSSGTKEQASTAKEVPVIETETVKAETVGSKQAEPSSPVKEVSKSKVEESQGGADPRNNIAFDEMGDAWEEAKSRGTKKRRARKD